MCGLTQVNFHNWVMNFKFNTRQYNNPIKQNYPGRTDEISFHAGFALYLLRTRRDTGLSKLSEISDKVEKIGQELAPYGKYKLSITGHSLGGALATICGFYFAATSRFASLPTIHVWTFAAPRVGTQAFLDAWQHLERAGRIQHARFSVPRDVVPLIPFYNFVKNDLQF
jgi:predicted lipase